MYIDKTDHEYATACYYCINSISKSGQSVREYLKGTNENIKRAYYISLAKERNKMVKLINK